jgi:hypothetical protein
MIVIVGVSGQLDTDNLGSLALAPNHIVSTH